MKTTISAVVLVTALSISSVFAQKMSDSNVPAAVKQTFAKTYAGAQKVKWDKEGSDYEASFTMNGEKKSAVYSASGSQKESELEIAVAKLPESVRMYMKSKGMTITEAAQITDASGKVYYEAEAGGKDFLFNTQGKPVKKIGE